MRIEVIKERKYESRQFLTRAKENLESVDIEKKKIKKRYTTKSLILAQDER